jgi:hypothetical protein
MYVSFASMGTEETVWNFKDQARKTPLSGEINSIVIGEIPFQSFIKPIYFSK